MTTSTTSPPTDLDELADAYARALHLAEHAEEPADRKQHAIEAGDLAERIADARAEVEREQARQRGADLVAAERRQAEQDRGAEEAERRRRAAARRLVATVDALGPLLARVDALTAVALASAVEVDPPTERVTRAMVGHALQHVRSRLEPGVPMPRPRRDPLAPIGPSLAAEVRAVVSNRYGPDTVEPLPLDADDLALLAEVTAPEACP